MDKTITMSLIIDKLRSSWKYFRRDLKHKNENTGLKNLANSVRVEEEFIL